MATLGRVEVEADVKISQQFPDWKTAVMHYAAEGMDDNWNMFIVRVRELTNALHAIDLTHRGQ